MAFGWTSAAVAKYGDRKMIDGMFRDRLNSMMRDGFLMEFGYDMRTEKAVDDPLAYAVSYAKDRYGIDISRNYARVYDHKARGSTDWPFSIVHVDPVSFDFAMFDFGDGIQGVDGSFGLSIPPQPQVKGLPGIFVSSRELGIRSVVQFDFESESFLAHNRVCGCREVLAEDERFPMGIRICPGFNPTVFESWEERCRIQERFARLWAYETDEDVALWPEWFEDYPVGLHTAADCMDAKGKGLI